VSNEFDNEINVQEKVSKFYTTYTGVIETNNPNPGVRKQYGGMMCKKVYLA